MYNEHYLSILVTFWGETEHVSGKNGALRWSILVGKQKYNVQKPNDGSSGHPKNRENSEPLKEPIIELVLSTHNF